MYKRLAVYLIIVSLLNLSGCYYETEVYPFEYQFDQNDRIYVTTSDTTYKLSSNGYYYQNDSLFFKITKRMTASTKGIFEISIPASDIEKITVLKTDYGSSTLIVLGIFAAIVIYGVAFEFDMKLNK